MKLTESITGDLIRVALTHGDGRLDHAPALAQSLRGSLLIDLTLMGRLTIGQGGTQVDTAPTGWALADIALHDVDEHPTATMERLIQRGRPHLDDVVEELVSSGVWEVTRPGIGAGHRRYTDSEEWTFRDLGVALDKIIAGGPARDERTAALAAVAAATGLTRTSSRAEVPGQVFVACGALESITRDVVTFVQNALATDLASGVIDNETGIWAP